MTDQTTEIDPAVEALNADQRAVFKAVAQHGPLTDDAIVDLTGLTKGTASPRRSDLVKRGLVQQAGMGKSALGNSARLWSVVPVEERQAARARHEKKVRRRPITDFPLSDRLEMVRQLLEMNDVNDAIRQKRGRAWSRARGRSQDHQGERKQRMRENEAALREAERQDAPIAEYYKLRRNLLQSVERVRAVQNLVTEELERREYGGIAIPLSGWSEVADLLDDLCGIAQETNEAIRKVMGALGDDVIEGTVIEIEEVLELPEG